MSFTEEFNFENEINTSTIIYAKWTPSEDDTADLAEPAIHDVKDIAILRPAGPYKYGLAVLPFIQLQNKKN